MLTRDQAKRDAKEGSISFAVSGRRASAGEINLRPQVLHKFCTLRPQVFHMIVVRPLSGALAGLRGSTMSARSPNIPWS